MELNKVMIEILRKSILNGKEMPEDIQKAVSLAVTDFEQTKAGKEMFEDCCKCVSDRKDARKLFTMLCLRIMFNSKANVPEFIAKSIMNK